MAKVKAEGEGRNFFSAPHDSGSQATDNSGEYGVGVPMVVTPLREQPSTTEKTESHHVHNKEIRRDKVGRQKRQKEPTHPVIKQAKRKENQQPNTAAIINYLKSTGDEKLEQKYLNQYYCRHWKYVEQGKAMPTSVSCKNRSCAMCSAIRAAILFDQYKQPLSKFASLVFVTLTAKSVKGSELKERIKKLTEIISRMVESQKQRYHRGNAAQRYRGLRKLEITIRPDDKYHPHFHLILSGTELWGKQIVAEWMRQCTEEGIEVSLKGQNVQQAENATKALEELTKYVVKNGEYEEQEGSDINRLRNHPPERQLVVWEAMRGKRAIHPIELKAVIEEKEAEEAEDIDELKGADVPDTVVPGAYKFRRNDWVHTVKDIGLCAQIKAHKDKPPSG
jgi:hypothetical protein